MVDIRIEGNQQSPTLAADGSMRAVRGLRTGEMGVAELIDMWIAEGRVFEVTVGGIAAGGDVALITGGGAGTTVDQDQPEFGVSVPAGTILVPLQIDIACIADLDANAEVGHVIVSYDKAAAWVGDGTVTTETPVNIITGGGVSSVASAFSAATADITDPTVSGILVHRAISASEFVSNGTATNLTNGLTVALGASWSAKRDIPVFIEGPGAFYGYWGGTAAVTGTARVVWAEIPATRFSF